MLHHGTKGGIIEVMGYLRGKVEGDTFYIMDAYPLPVEGTETRVNAGSEAIEYQGTYEDLNEVKNRNRSTTNFLGDQERREMRRLVPHTSKLRAMVVWN
jgi:proteasome lid subunit RPN8/RPN11